MDLIHRNCGGIVEPDDSLIYEYEGSTYPGYRCQECGQEILGDADLEDLLGY